MKPLTLWTRFWRNLSAFWWISKLRPNLTKNLSLTRTVKSWVFLRVWSLVLEVNVSWKPVLAYGKSQILPHPDHHLGLLVFCLFYMRPQRMFQSPWNHHHIQKMCPPHVSKEGKTWFLNLHGKRQHEFLGRGGNVQNHIASCLKKVNREKSNGLSLQLESPNKPKGNHIEDHVLCWWRISLLINFSDLRIWLSLKLEKIKGAATC